MLRAVCLLFLTLLVGCGATGLRYSEMNFDEPGEKSELIVFRQRKFVDAGGCYVIKIEDEELGVLANGGFLRTLVDPGPYVLSIPQLNDNVLKIQVVARVGHTNFVEYNTSFAGMTIIPAGYTAVTNVSLDNRFSEVPPEHAEKLLQDLKDSSVKPSCMATL